METITGAEFKAFYNDNSFWSRDAGIEELELSINGKVVSDDIDVAALKNSDEIRILDGYESDSDSLVADLFTQWKTEQTTTYITVTVPKNRLDEFKALVDNAGFIGIRP